MKKIISIFALLILVMFTGCTKIDQTERGVILHGGSVAGTVDAGYTPYIPIYTEIVHMPVKVQLESMRIEAGSKDMQQVTVGVNVNYHIDPVKVAETYSKYGLDVVVTALQPKMRETITGVTPQYKPEEMLQKREEVRLRMENALRAKLDSAESHIIIDGFTIYLFQFTDKFNTAIEDKQVAEQNAEKEKNIKKMVEYQRDQKIISAQADSSIKVMNAKADSIAISIALKALSNPNAKTYISKLWIDAWNGELPKVAGNEKIMPIIDMK